MPAAVHVWLVGVGDLLQSDLLSLAPGDIDLHVVPADLVGESNASGPEPDVIILDADSADARTALARLRGRADAPPVVGLAAAGSDAMGALVSAPGAGSGLAIHAMRKPVDAIEVLAEAVRALNARRPGPELAALAETLNARLFW